MRFLVEIRIPVEAGNAALKDGTLLKQLQNYLNDVKPETVYFTPANGQRTVYLVLNVQSADQLTVICEPPWLDWKAEVRLTPVMTAEDFEKAGPGLQKVVEARK